MAYSDNARHFSVFRESLVAAMVATFAATALMLGVLAVNPPTFRAVALLRFETAQSDQVRRLAFVASDPAELAAFGKSEGLAVDPAFQPPPLNVLLDRLAGRNEEDSWLRIAPADDGRTLRIFVTATDPQRAADVATALAARVLVRAEAQAVTAEPIAEQSVPTKVQVAEPAKDEGRAADKASSVADDQAVRQIEIARQKLESAEAALQRFLTTVPSDATLDQRLAEARGAFERATTARKEAEARLAGLVKLTPKPAHEIIADPAFDGETFATLRIRHEAAAALERALASQLLDLHPMLIDARQSLRAADEAVKTALTDLIDSEKQKVESASRIEKQASAALAPLQSKETDRLASKAQEATLREAAEQARIAYEAERDKPRAPSPTLNVTLEKPEAEQQSPPEKAKTKPTLARPTLVAAADPTQPTGLKPMVLLTSSALLGAALGLLIGGVAASIRPISGRSAA